MEVIVPLIGIGSILWCVVSLFMALFPGGRKKRLRHAGISFGILVFLLVTSQRQDSSRVADVRSENEAATASDENQPSNADHPSRPPAKPRRIEQEPTIPNAQAITQMAALDACERVAKAAANNPSTVRMSRIMNASFRTWPNGAARLQTTFTAKNAFNLELTFVINCFFEENRLVDYSISER